ncbi:MAG: hypothetical protein QGF55_04495 [SAR324 cluster bacterium]|nr:hypothetical protein [SAR324 cluster bacterium]
MSHSSNFESEATVSCAVPRSGRTLQNFLSRLKPIVSDSGEIVAMQKVLSEGKKKSTQDIEEAFSQLNQLPRNVPKCFSVFIDRKRTPRPFRLGFLSHEWEVNGISLRVEGEEPHNGSSLIKLDEVDFTLVGLDELLAMTQYYLRDPTHVTKWGMYNYQLIKPTSIRVAGSAELTRYNPVLGCEVQDMVGFFLISKPGGRGRSKIDFQTLSRYGRRVFVKGRYSGIVMAAYPGLQVEPVENVEDSVMDAEMGSVGIEIVQTGNTLRSKGLLLHGAPLFLSESLYVVDYDRYQSKPQLRELLETLNPLGYFDDRRIQHFARWYLALEINMGEFWLDRPDVEELFCTRVDPERGLRPYRLKTRNWRPHDSYKREEAMMLADESREKLKRFYEQLKTPNSTEKKSHIQLELR